MGEILAFSQSSLLLSRSSLPRRVYLIGCSHASLPVTPPKCFLSTKQEQRSIITKARVVSDSKVPTTFTVDSAGGGIDILPDSGGSDDNLGGANNGGSGNGGGGGGGDYNGDKSENEDESGSHENKPGMSMSQKLTLGYASLVGIGGLMGYLKGGSKKSLIAGGVSASILYGVYALLPSNPIGASCVGCILSLSLLVVMGLRFKNSGKVFPAGAVAFTSLVMAGGYMHGIFRSVH